MGARRQVTDALIYLTQDSIYLLCICADIQKAVTVRQKLDAQLNENTLVKEVCIIVHTFFESISNCFCCELAILESISYFSSVLLLFVNILLCSLT